MGYDMVKYLKSTSKVIIQLLQLVVATKTSHPRQMKSGFKYILFMVLQKTTCWCNCLFVCFFFFFLKISNERLLCFLKLKKKKLYVHNDFPCSPIKSFQEFQLSCKMTKMYRRLYCSSLANFEDKLLPVLEKHLILRVSWFNFVVSTTNPICSYHYPGDKITLQYVSKQNGQF